LKKPKHCYKKHFIQKIAGIVFLIIFLHSLPGEYGDGDEEEFRKALFFIVRLLKRLLLL